VFLESLTFIVKDRAPKFEILLVDIATVTVPSYAYVRELVTAPGQVEHVTVAVRPIEQNNVF